MGLARSWFPKQTFRNVLAITSYLQIINMYSCLWLQLPYFTTDCNPNLAFELSKGTIHWAQSFATIATINSNKLYRSNDDPTTNLGPLWSPLRTPWDTQNLQPKQAVSSMMLLIVFTVASSKSEPTKLFGDIDRFSGDWSSVSCLGYLF